jgi:hypothetical protein
MAPGDSGAALVLELGAVQCGAVEVLPGLADNRGGHDLFHGPSEIVLQKHERASERALKQASRQMLHSADEEPRRSWHYCERPDDVLPPERLSVLSHKLREQRRGERECVKSLVDCGLELSLERVRIVGEGVGAEVCKASERPVGERVQGAVSCGRRRKRV